MTMNPETLREAMINLLLAEKTHEEIALALGIKRSTAGRYIRQMQLGERRNKRPTIDLDSLRKLAMDGITISGAAERFGVKRAYISELCRINDILISGRKFKLTPKSSQREYLHRDPIIVNFIDPNPPSLAMIRLAQFDPVIARALAVRTGQPFE